MGKVTAPVTSIVLGTPLNHFTDHYGRPVPVTPVKGPGGFSALAYKCPLNVDWDGSSTAYGLDRTDSGGQTFPLQKRLQPQESGQNGSLEDGRAKGDRHWVGVVSKTEAQARWILANHYPHYKTLKPGVQASLLNQFLDTRDFLKDVNGTYPLVQMKELGGLSPGYYVSQCNARTGITSNDWEQRSYIDAGTVNYAALPLLPGVKLGDFGLIIRVPTGDSAAFFFGDTGAGYHLGECSGAVKLAIAPARNAEDDEFLFLVFPGSGSGSAKFGALLTIPKVLTQIAKLRDTSNTLSRQFAKSATQNWMIMSALSEWGGQAPKVSMHLW